MAKLLDGTRIYGSANIDNNLIVNTMNVVPTIVAAFGQANTANTTSVASFAQANSANLIANLAYDKANIANVFATSAFSAQNVTSAVANAAFNKANTANITADAAFAGANAANLIANLAYDKANIANVIASGAYDKANTANVTANSAFAKANLSAPIASPTFTGTVTSPSPLILLKVLDPSEGGEITFEKASSSNLSGNLTLDLFGNLVRIFEATGTNRGFFLDITKANTGTAGEILHTNNWFNFISTSGDPSAAFNKANTANITADAAFARANAANLIANLAFDKANIANVIASGAYDKANTANITADSAFARANAANLVANLAYDKANTANITADAAFARANSANLIANLAYDKANTANVIASGAYDKANTANITADSAFARANAANLIANLAYDKANTANITADAAFARANAANLIANLAYDKANTANVIASGAYDKANTANITACAAFAQANTANTTSVAAFAKANAAFPSTGGSISGDVFISGNLTVIGNSTVFNVSSLVVNDPLIFLANNNYSSDLVDIGFVGHYNDGVNAHTGFIRDATSKEYFIFNGYTLEVFANDIINIAHPSFALTNINANYYKGNLIANTVVIAISSTVAGVNIVPTLSSAFDKANTANITADAAFARANAANLIANLAFDKANTANVFAVAAFDRANTANIIADAAFGRANTANITADASFARANAANLIANLAFDRANTANVTACAAFAAANTMVMKAGNTMTGNLVFSAANITFLSSATSFSNLGIYFSNTPTVGIESAIYSNAANILVFATQKLERVRIDAGGRLNIGTIDIVQFSTSAYGTSNAAFGRANSANLIANLAYDKANTANVIASGAYDKANSANLAACGAFAAANTMVMKTGNTMTGNLVMSGANITFVTATNSGIYWGGTGLSFIHSPAANTLVFGTSSAEDMRIDSSGNVGIRTATPTATLDVNGNFAITGTASRITGDFTSDTLNDRASFQTRISNGNTNVFVLPNGLANISSWSVFNNSNPTNSSFGGIRIDGYTSEFQLRSSITGSGSSYFPMTFLVGGAERMRIDNSGRVGIGTSSPSTNLHMVVGGTSSIDGILIDNGASHTIRISPKSGPGSHNPITGDGDKVITFTDGSVSTSGNLTIAPWSTITSGIRILFDGKVGIATSTPAATLDVVGSFSDAKANTLSQTLTDGASIAWDASLGRVAVVTLGGARSLANATNLRVGTYILRVQQNTSGGSTLTFGRQYKFTANVAPTLTSAANSVDIFSFVSDGTNMYGAMIPDVRS